MIIGIDGNMWYCSNGMCLGDPRSQFTFARTLREAYAEYQKQFRDTDELPAQFTSALDMTPEQFGARQEG